MADTGKARKESNKRPSDQVTGSTESGPPYQKPRVNGKETTKEKTKNGDEKAKDFRWRTHSMTEEYVNLVGELMYPKLNLGPYGYEAENGRFPIDRITTLGLLLNPLRKPLPIEKWSPYEIAIFEASITLHGKDFNKIQKLVETKSVKQIIEFYYDWKKTSHYKQWKKAYTPDEREHPDDSD